MNAAKTASRRNLLSMLTLTKRNANAIAKTIERINNTIERFSLSIQITIYRREDKKNGRSIQKQKMGKVSF